MATKGEWIYRPLEFNQLEPAVGQLGSIEAYNKDDELLSRYICTIEDVENEDGEQHQIY